ncbi:10855_t:CDS:2, partial [Rhizophagus irregularis]
MKCENVYQPKSAIRFLLLINSEDPIIEALLRHENRHPISNHHNMPRMQTGTTDFSDKVDKIMQTKE